MASSDFYRRQAEALLQQAELAEAIEKLSELPEGSVVTYTKDTYAYAALSVRVHSAEDEVYWFTTGTTRRAAQSTSDFISHLVSHRATNIAVWMDAVPLEQWPNKDITVDGTPRA